MTELLPPELLAAPEPLQRVPQRWTQRLLDALSTYLPLLLMALLALGSWWLVKNTPLFEAARPAAPLRHVPDYTMSRFNVQRFAPDGSLRTQLEGDVLRHYPDTDTLEIDNPRIRANAPKGSSAGVTLASARQALSNGDGSQVQLIGAAHVVRQAPDGSETLEFRGEFLHAFLNTEQLRSHLPVTVTRGGTELHADTMDYDHLDRVVNLKGRVKASFGAPQPAVKRVKRMEQRTEGGR